MSKMRRPPLQAQFDMVKTVDIGLEYTFHTNMWDLYMVRICHDVYVDCLICFLLVSISAHPIPSHDRMPFASFTSIITRNNVSRYNSRRLFVAQCMAMLQYLEFC